MMELLSTVYYVATNDADAARSPDEAARAVHAYNNRKATTMKPQHIKTAWQHMHELGYGSQRSHRRQTGASSTDA